MTLTLDLPDDKVAALRAEAARRGVEVEDVVADLLTQLRGSPQPERRLGFVGLGASTSGRGARDADDMLAEGFGRS